MKLEDIKQVWCKIWKIKYGNNFVIVRDNSIWYDRVCIEEANIAMAIKDSVEVYEL